MKKNESQFVRGFKVAVQDIGLAVGVAVLLALFTAIIVLAVAKS